jgi:peptidylprolyl isomerase
MKHIALGLAAIALSAAAPAQEAAPSPNQIVEAAAPEEWIAIPAEDLLVMTLSPDNDGNPREVIIQLMPAPFSQGWVHNIKLLSRSGWYDGISVNRVQDNYVVQWGDPNYDNPEATGETKSLPLGLMEPSEDQYIGKFTETLEAVPAPCGFDEFKVGAICDPYSGLAMFRSGWPMAMDRQGQWPVHCYGMVGVGRNYSPDTGSGAELYTVIGHAPRHLDRNIALVGRVIEGMEHLSSLPRGKGELGFYAEDEADKRTPILTVRVASDIPEFPQPTFEYLSTDSESFARYAEARANRRDPFFIVPAGGADVCNIPVPVRRVVTE